MKVTVYSNTKFSWARMQGVKLHHEDKGDYSFEVTEIVFGYHAREPAKFLSDDIRASIRSKLRTAIGMKPPLLLPTP